jgi:predicted PurR-regulated permease PerM
VSLFIALALEPAVNKMASRGFKRGSATALLILAVVIAVLGFVAAMGTVVTQQIADVLSNSEKYVNDTVKIINDTFNANIDPAAVNERISDPNGAVQKFIDSQQDNVFRVSVQALGVLFQGFSVLLFSFYLVADGPRLRRSICSRLRPERQRAVLDAWELAITKTGGFLYSRALLAVVSGFFHWIALQAIGAPAPIAMGLWVGLVSQFLPVIGTYLAGVLPVLLTFVDSPVKAVAVIGFILVYQQLENYLLAPRITARTLELHPALAFGGALAGSAVLGPIGAILALPAVAMGQALISAWGVRHEVIDDPLTKLPESKQKKSRRTQSPGGWDDPS